MSKKPHKVEETQAPYAPAGVAKAAAPAGKPASDIRYMDNDSFKKAADKVFKVHRELFRKLSQ